jgi:phosphate transport system substrate-binding protein
MGGPPDHPYEWGRGRTPSVIFREAVLAGGEFNASVHAERTSSSLVQAVAADPGGICYDFFCFQSKRARAIPIRTDDGQFLLPDEASCQQGRYPLARFHYIYFDHRPGEPVAPTTAAFLSFILSRQGQQIVIDNGSYPLAAEMAAEQREFLRN